MGNYFPCEPNEALIKQTVTPMKIIQLHEKIDINSLYINLIGLDESKRFFFYQEIKSAQGLTPTKATSLVGTTSTLAGKAG